MSQPYRPTPMELKAQRARAGSAGLHSLKRKERSDQRRPSLGGRTSSPLTLVPAPRTSCSPSSSLTLTPAAAGPQPHAPSGSRDLSAARTKLRTAALQAAPLGAFPALGASAPAVPSAGASASPERGGSSLCAPAAGVRGPLRRPEPQPPSNGRAEAPSRPACIAGSQSAPHAGGGLGACGRLGLGHAAGAAGALRTQALGGGCGASLLLPTCGLLGGRAGGAPAERGGGGALAVHLRRRASEQQAQAQQHELLRATRDAGALRAAGATQPTRGGLCVGSLPWDWAVRQGVGVSSRLPLDWAARLTAHEEGAALLEACGARRPHAPDPAAPGGAPAEPRAEPGGTEGEGVGAGVRGAFAAALIYWQHGVSGGGGAAGGGSDGGAALRCAHGEWLESLRSAYYLLRHGLLPYFYLSLPNSAGGAGSSGGNGCTTVLWRNADVPTRGGGGAEGETGAPPPLFAGASELCGCAVYAVMSGASASLCAQLGVEGVPFEQGHHTRGGGAPQPAPKRGAAARAGGGSDGSGSGSGSGSDGEGEEEGEAPALRLAALSRAPSLGGSSAPAGGGGGGAGRRAGGVGRAPLLFGCHEGVHGLFDFLTANTTPAHAAAARLLAPAPFLNAACRRLRVQRCGPLLQRAASGSAPRAPESAARSGAPAPLGGGSVESVASLQLSGCVLPCAVRAICDALQQAQRGQFKLTAPPADGTHALNAARAPAGDAAGAAGAGPVGVVPGLPPVSFAEVERCAGQWHLTLPSGTSRY